MGEPGGVRAFHLQSCMSTFPSLGFCWPGGLLLGVYTLSVWPTMVNQVSACPPGRTLVLANLVYIAQVLFQVWTVAFNFVPGGVYTREHTDWLILIVMGFILLGLKSGEWVSGYCACL